MATSPLSCSSSSPSDEVPQSDPQNPPAPEDDVSRKLSFSKVDADDDGEMVKVYLRFRPHEKVVGGRTVLEYTKSEDDALVIVDEKTVETIAPKESQSFKNRETGGTFEFTRVFDKPTTQEELFVNTTENLVDTLLQGKDGLLFAYGVTNAGKTYTVEGTETEPGIIPRALQLIFDKIENTRENTPKVEISYLQVYNEQVHDLQGCAKSTKNMERLRIKLRDEGVEVEGLKASPITTCKEGLEILSKGREVRTTHETECNLQSSRSHSVFVVSVEPVDRKKKPARLYIVDLAGSERAKRTLTSRARQREASNINCSLMNLMRCLDTLRLNQKNKRLNKKEKMVPFRESKLTLLFRDCFIGGNCGGVAMIVNASTRPTDYDETAHALKYGALVKNVQINRKRVVARRASAVKYGFDGRRLGKNNKTQKGRLSGGEQQQQHGHDELDDLVGLEEHPVVSALVYELADARMRCVTLESEIREEVAQEMAERLREMETAFHKHVDAAKQISESKSEMLLKNLRKRINEGGKDTVYTKGEIEALVQNIEECEEEMTRMRQANAAEVGNLKSEVERLTRNRERRKSTEQAHRQSFERLDSVVVEQLDTIARYKEELEEERALHEKTVQQLESAMQLTIDYQNGEAEKQRQIYSLTMELEQLKKKQQKESSFSSAATSSFSSAGGLLKHVTSSPRLPRRPTLTRRSRSKGEMQERKSKLRNHSSAPALDETWTLADAKGNDSSGSSFGGSMHQSEPEQQKNTSTPKKGLIARILRK